MSKDSKIDVIGELAGTLKVSGNMDDSEVSLNGIASGGSLLISGDLEASVIDLTSDLIGSLTTGRVKNGSVAGCCFGFTFLHFREH